jgi:NTE family protein
VTPHIVEIAFDNLKDPEERKFFNSVKTSFNLDDATVDRLIEVGGRLLRESPEYQKLLASMN